MQVTVHLHTIFQIQTPQGLVRELTLEIEAGNSLKEISVKLGIQPDPEETLFVVNGRIVELDYKLKHGDVIHFIPAISGGGMGASRNKLQEPVLSIHRMD